MSETRRVESADTAPNTSKTSGWRKVTVSVCLALLIVVWMLQAIFIKNSDYQQWFFMVYFVHSLYASFVPIWYIWSKLRNKPIATLDWPRICLITTAFAALYLLCGVSWYISLPWTPVSANTAVTNSACTVVFLLSVLFLHEKVKVKKVVSMVMSLVGVYLIYRFGQIKDTDEGEHESSFGYMLVITSTVLYAIYQVLYSKFGDLYVTREPVAPERTPLMAEASTTVVAEPAKPVKSTEDDVLNSMLFLGMMGVMCLCLFWVLFPIFHVTEVERFVPPTAHQWKNLIAMGGIATLFDVLILICISLSSPFYMSIASMLSMPASMLADFLVYGYTLPMGSAVGVLCILVGFVGLSF